MILIEIGNRQPQTGTQPLFFISYPPQYDGSHLPQYHQSYRAGGAGRDR